MTHFIRRFRAWPAMLQILLQLSNGYPNVRELMENTVETKRLAVVKGIGGVSTPRLDGLPAEKLGLEKFL
jgi:hypothetical protein